MSDKSKSDVKSKAKSKDFILKSMKRLPNGGLAASFVANTVVGSEIYKSTVSKESDQLPSPDLTSKLELLKPMLMEVFRYKKGEFLTVNGISLSGTEKNAGIIIKGKVKTHSGVHTAINTPRMKFNVTTYGYEEEMKKITDELTAEVYEYLFNGKAAQLEMGLE